MLSNDLYERITVQIADAVEAGAGTFKMPWSCWGEGSAVPVNAITGTRYSGFNILMLWASCAASGYSSGLSTRGGRLNCPVRNYLRKPWHGTDTGRW